MRPPARAGVPSSLKNRPIFDVLIRSITAGSEARLRQACFACPGT
jgi:hypothetical protein